MSRSFLDDNKALGSLLLEIERGTTGRITHYIKHALIDAGFITLDKVEGAGPGRQFEKPVLTGKGRSRLALYKAHLKRTHNKSLRETEEIA